MQVISYVEIDEMLKPLAPFLAREADAILDLRELIARQGHPGKCVKCFFRLFEAAGEPALPKLAPLRKWLEGNVEICVRGDGLELESRPLALASSESLEAFCLRSIHEIRMDRGYGARRVELAFRYKTAA